MAGLEVLGALAAASQLTAQGLKIAIFVSDLYSKVSDAPESIRKQSIQVEQLIGVARLIERNPQLQTEQVASILCNCISEAEDLKQVLTSISAAAGDGKVRKLWKSLDGVAKEKRILALVTNLEREKSSLMLCIGTIDSALLSTVHNELPTISGKMTAIHDAMQRSTVTSQLTVEQWRDYCLAALFLVDPLDNRAELVTVKGQRVQGTCQWITTNETYVSWLASPSQLLWLSGGPGKGKTMLSIFLTEELDKTTQQSQSAKKVLVYFFCDNKDNRRNTAVAILRGLIWQLIQQDSKLLDHIVPSFKIQKEDLFSNSSFESLWRIFENMVQDPGLDSVFCVLDGLDECDKHSLEGFSEKLRGFCSKSPTGLKVIVVSRELPDCIPRAMSGFPRVRLDPDSDREISNDLQKYIAVKVNELSEEKLYSGDLRAFVERTLLERAKGTFLWASFVVKELREMAPTEVEDCLNDLPTGLEGMYGRMLLDIREERRNIAASILCWVTMAVRPLTLTELGAATKPSLSANLSIEEVIRDHVGFCGCLLIVTGNHVVLVHQSVKDYLLRRVAHLNPRLEFFRMTEEKANSEIARTCFNYLQSGALAEGSVRLVGTSYKPADISRLQAFPLLSYAVLHWLDHARCSSSLVDDIFDLSIPFYENNSPVREAWSTTYWAAKGYWGLPDLSSPLHFTAFFGIVPLTRNLLRRRWKDLLRFYRYVDKRDSQGKTPLHWAAQNGHEAVVRLLLERKADVNAKNSLGMPVLLQEVRVGHEAMVRLLLEHKADVNAKNSLGMPVLLQEVGVGHEAMVRLLLEHKADVNVRDNKYGLTALSWAALNGHETVTRLLLEHKADVNVKDKDGLTALSWAARSGCETVTRLLLEHKADVNVKDKYGLTALSWAALSGHETVTRLLLEHKADVNVKDKDGWTALSWAARNRHKTVTRLLLEHKADVNVKDKDGLTALSRAARNGHKTVTRLLLEHKADVNVKDKDGLTALSWAIKNSHEEVVQLIQTSVHTTN